MNGQELLLPTLRNPTIAASLDLAAWDRLIREARAAKVLARLAFLLDERGILKQVPERPRAHLEAARIIAEKHASVMRWETACVRRALRGLSIPLVLLKGAAYVLADLPPARGRFFSDLDLMVPKADLAIAERTLLAHGWQAMKVHPYDQRYYRQWMHELPPLLHGARRTVLDLHHTILPETGRLRPDPARLFEASVPVGVGTFRVLAPTDMVLHSAAHLFQDGDLAGGIRDLTDLDDLLRHFGRQAEFWSSLVPRAVELDLTRPLYYALRFTRQIFHTPIPEEVLGAATEHAPAGPVRVAMDALVRRSLTPTIPDRVPVSVVLARWLLYARSHWLRMPPGLLLAHLARKAVRRWCEDEPEAAPQAALPDAPAGTGEMPQP